MNRSLAYMRFVISFFLTLFLLASQRLAESSQQSPAMTPEQKKASQILVKEMIAQKQSKNSYNDSTWNSIRNQKVNTAGPLTLSEILDIALQNNPQTKKAWFDAESAVAQSKQAKSSLMPQLQSSVRLDKEKIVSSQQLRDLNVTNYGPNLQLTFLLLDLGGRSATIKEAMQNLFAANSQYELSIQDLLLRVAKAYFGFYSTQSAQEAAEADVAAAKKDLEAAEARFGAGIVPKLDVLQAQSDYEDSLFTLVEAKSRVKSAKALLAQEMGLAADTPFEIAPPTGKFPTQISEQDVSQLIDTAIGRRPDIIASRATLEAKKAALKAANSNLWPTLNLGGSAGRNWNDYRSFPAGNDHEYNYAG